jgi:hypothetical protein
MAEEQEKKASSPGPVALALVVCDAIWRDPWTGKRTIIGCFSAIFAQTFPVIHPVMAVYVALTDGHGTVPINVRLIDVDEERPALFEVKFDAPWSDPRVVLELDFGVNNVTFPAPGEYRLQVRAGQNPLIERRIVVLMPGDKKNEPDRDAQND